MENENSPEIDTEAVNVLQAEDRKINRRVDRSLVVALVAVAISLIGTLVSIYEARILRDQQSLLTQQKSASLWPYVVAVPNMTFSGDSSVELRMEVINNGIGPAILGDVKYLYREEGYESYSIHRPIQKEYKPIFDIQLTQNYQLDSSVLQPGELALAFTLNMNLIEPDSSISISNIIANKLSVEFCYCSVYGDCWYRGFGITPQKRSDCESYITY